MSLNEALKRKSEPLKSVRKSTMMSFDKTSCVNVDKNMPKAINFENSSGS